MSEKSLEKLYQDYPHLKFAKNWQFSIDTAIALGECAGLVDAIAEFPLQPEVRGNLLRVSLTRGAQATTAIEGNTLTDDEVRAVLAGKEIPASRQYQAQEITNAVDAMNKVWKEMQPPKKPQLISPQLICSFHKEIGKNLGDVFDAIPGKTRKDRRHVGTYLAPDHIYVDTLLSELCNWLKQNFHYANGNQTIPDAIQQAVAAHVYFEWIHPFGDGNGRTGRLIEFYILLRAGVPDICSHVLANHYNKSRQEYTHHFDQARKKKSLSGFMEYSICGLRDGLREVMKTIEEHMFQVAWRTRVYDQFSTYTEYRKRIVFKRRRNLALAMPLHGKFFLHQLALSTPEMVAHYGNVTARTIQSDMDAILELDLAEDLGGGFYEAKIDQLRDQKARRLPKQSNC